MALILSSLSIRMCARVCVVVHNEIYIAHAVPKIGDVTKSRMGLLTSMSSVL